MKRPAACLAVLTLASLATASLAEAGGFAIREQSAWGQGSSFAGVAAGGSLSTMFWNPATLSGVEGFEIENVITRVIPIAEVDYTPPATDAGDIGLDAFVPAGYGALRLSDRLVVGVGLNGAFGLSTSYANGSTIRVNGVAGTSKVFSLNLNPAAAYQVTDWLTVGVGAQLQYLDLKYTDQAIPGIGVSNLTGDDIGFGITAGLELTPWAGTNIGIGYRSRIDHDIEGRLTSGALGFNATGHDFDLPDIVTLGIRQSINDRFRVMAGAEWANWSRFDTVTVSIPGVDIPLSFDYQDGWFFSAGGEFDLMPNLTLRGGVGYELSPIDDSNRTFRLPDSDRLWLSAGASYDLNQRWSFDAAYTFILNEDADILAAAGGGPAANGPFSGSADTNIHLISAGVKVKLGALR